MVSFRAIGYHGTDRDIVAVDDIYFEYKQYQDHFLGAGLYLWRDSYQRALSWTDNQHKENELKNVIELEIKIKEDEILNFTSSKWGNEFEILKIFSEVCKSKKIHFGSFLDFLIYELGVEIKGITMIDLKTKNHFVPIKSKAKTLFAYGDIQICVKSKDIVENFRQMDRL